MLVDVVPGLDEQLFVWGRGGLPKLAEVGWEFRILRQLMAKKAEHVDCRSRGLCLTIL